MPESIAPVLAVPVKRGTGLPLFLPVLVILFAAALLRVPHVGPESLWLDETFTHWVVTQPFTDGLATIQRDMKHPPLFYLLTLGAVAVLGDGHMGLRIVSLLSSIALAGVAFGLARRVTHGNLWAGLTAGLVVGVSDMQIFHAISARGYAFWSLLIALMAWSFFLILTEPSRRGPRLAYALLAIAAVLTHLFTLLFIAALGLVALVVPARRRAVRDLAILSLPAAVATASWLAMLPSPERLMGASVLSWIPQPTPWRVLRVGLHLFGLPLVPYGTRLSAAGVLLLALLVAVILLRKPDRRPAVSREALWLIGALALVPAALTLLAWMVTGRSYWIARQLLPSQPFVAIAGALGIVVLANQSRGLAATALTGWVLLNNPGRLYGPPALLNDPYNRVAVDLRTEWQPGELRVATTARALWVLNYYLPGPDSASLVGSGPYIPNLVDWTPFPYPPLADSTLTAASALLVVWDDYPAPRLDSLRNAGWRTEWYREYFPPARRPDLWPSTLLRLEKLVGSSGAQGPSSPPD